MFSALKKLTSKSEIQNVPPETAGQPMSGTLQKKFSRGVQYNMKIIIKGDRNVGKSCLLERLQGRGFIETYMPTEEIQVASIQWSFKATEDIVKVEVWDVVDRGKARIRNTNGLKLTSNIPTTEVPALDAEFLDVYKGTHGVILMMDVTKMWTFEYVQREIDKIPPELPILVLGNHCDMGHHRVVTEGQVIGFIENLPRRPGEIQYGESSMRNGFGLRLLHKFLGLPFLHLQKATLLSLVERNKKDTEICSFEITEFLKSDEADYNKFIDNLTNKRRSIADNNPKSVIPISIPHSPSSSSVSSNASVGVDVLRPTKSIIVGGGQPIVIPGQLNVTNDPKFRAQSNATNSAKNTSSNILTMRNEVQEAIAPLKSIPVNNVVSVDEFCPDGGLDKGFLDDFTSSPLNSKNYNSEKVPESDTDTEENGINPLVASFSDEPEYEESQRATTGNLANIEIQHQLKVNPLASKTIRKPIILEPDNTSFRKLSISSEEILTNDHKSHHGGSNFTPDELNDWLSDTNLRRSPEGGEDLPVVTVNQEPFTDNISVHKLDDSVKMKKHKKHKKDKKEKKDRSSRSGDGDDSGDNKSISKKEKKSKKSRKKDEDRTAELDDFLNGGPNDSYEHRDNEYECI